MSFFIPLGIVVLAMLIMAFLQLTPGVFMLFSHYVYGKYSKARASHMSMYFILGAEVSSACLFLCCYLIANLLFLSVPRPETSILAWLAAGIMFVLSILSLFCYFRPHRNTQLFIPRVAARSLDSLARKASSRSDAFALGALSGFYELAFTLPLYIITSVEIIEMSVQYSPSHLLTILYILALIIPLFFIRWSFRYGRNLVDLQKSRTRHQTFTRIILFASYLAIAILILIFRTTLQ